MLLRLHVKVTRYHAGMLTSYVNSDNVVLQFFFYSFIDLVIDSLMDLFINLLHFLIYVFVYLFTHSFIYYVFH